MMCCILTDPFPETVEVSGKQYPIQTDYKDWINFGRMMLDPDISEDDKLLAVLGWYKETLPNDPADAILALNNFYAGGLSPDIKPKTAGQPAHKRPLLSFEYDGAFILSGFLEYYGIDLTAADMHWWKFKALLEGLPDSCELKKRMAYRAVNLSEIKDKNERRRIRKIQRSIMIPCTLNDRDIGDAFAGVI